MSDLYARSTSTLKHQRQLPLPSQQDSMRMHPFVQDLLARLQRRLTPLKWLTISVGAGL